MTPKQYIFGMATLILAVLSIPPWLIEAFKVYVISVVVFIAMLWHFLFSLQKIREMIIKRLLADLMEELFKEPVFAEFLTKKFQEKYFKGKTNEQTRI